MISFRQQTNGQKCCGYVPYYERTTKNGRVVIHTIFSSHVETVVLLSQQKADDHIEVDLELDELDITNAETKAAYRKIQQYVMKQTGMMVSNLNIAQIRRKCGLDMRENFNLPKSKDAKQPKCPEKKEKAIREALEHFGMV